MGAGTAVGELRCSPAFDWHLSSLVERGKLNAYGMLPEAVWMPKQGCVGTTLSVICLLPVVWALSTALAPCSVFCVDGGD